MKSSIRQTARTIDFVTMYPSFDQALLKDRLRDAIEEAWDWEQQRMKHEDVLRIKRDGWLRLTPQEAGKPSVHVWSKEEIQDMVAFVIDNGYI